MTDTSKRLMKSLLEVLSLDEADTKLLEGTIAVIANSEYSKGAKDSIDRAMEIVRK